MELTTLHIKASSHPDDRCGKCKTLNGNRVFLSYILHSIPESQGNWILCPACAISMLRSHDAVWQAKKKFAKTYLQLVYTR